MKVQVKLFALARQATGYDMIEVDVGPEATVAGLRRELARQVPSLATLIPHLMIAVNTEYAEERQPLHAHDEIACIPPVSGG